METVCIDFLYYAEKTKAADCIVSHKFAVPQTVLSPKKTNGCHDIFNPVKRILSNGAHSVTGFDLPAITLSSQGVDLETLCCKDAYNHGSLCMNSKRAGFCWLVVTIAHRVCTWRYDVHIPSAFYTQS